MRLSRRDNPQLLTPALLRRWRLPQPARERSKEERGRALIIAGAVEMPGAAVLAATAALRAGAGKVRVAIAEPAMFALATAVPELFVQGIAEGSRRAESLRAVLESARNTDVVLIGPGMRDLDAIRFLVPELLRIGSLGALVIDASAIAIAVEFLHRHRKSRGHTIITPHQGEMTALTKMSREEIARDCQRLTRETAARYASVVVAKGAETFISGEDGRVFQNKRGNVGLATAGSGDVLAGIMAGLCARGAEPLQAAVWAVWIHALAGERLAKRIAPMGYLARELLEEIPRLAG
ncbi:MAG TPA: NAD(P)H-hydrate dehydratase [Chthoniobacterales bacterium]|nr:NAD(P)H-hydrate dehydratase [Chthoniobacterales bacterium]